ncbi:MAG: hypothetical protein WA549_07025 [Thermoplasmata archaeon]
MAPATSAEAPTIQHPSQIVPAVLSVIGLAIGFIAGLLSWFVISGSNFTLLTDSYHALYVYGTQGGSALGMSSALGAALYKASTSNPIVLVAFAIVLFFWPAMIVSSAFSLLIRSFGPYPFVWGLIAFVFAYIMMYYAGDSLGTGAYLDLVAAIIFLVASITVRQARAVPAAAAPAPTAPPSS